MASRNWISPKHPTGKFKVELSNPAVIQSFFSSYRMKRLGRVNTQHWSRPESENEKVKSPLSIQGLRLPTHQGAHILVEGFNPCWLCWIDYSKDCLGRGIALFCFICFFFPQLGLIIWKKGQCEYGLEKGGKKRLNWKREKLERVSGNWKVRNGGKNKKKIK